MSVAKNLIEKIEEKGWTYAATAKRSNISISTLNNIIYGESKGSIETLAKLADTLGCRVSDLKEGVGDEDLPKSTFDEEIFGYCFNRYAEFIKNKGLKISQERSTRVISKLTSFCKKKKSKNSPYHVDDDLIEWVIEYTKY